MAEDSNGQLRIAETNTSNFFYHLVRIETSELKQGKLQGICGKEFTGWETGQRVEGWGHKDHIPSRWCSDCITILATEHSWGKYAEWIRANVSPYLLGTCAAATLAMAQQFPELMRVRGHYAEPHPAWGNRQHWWLTTPEGVIIDPTATQFPSNGQGEYLPWKEGDEEPVGKCAYCSEGIYKSKTKDGVTCDDTCSKPYAAYINEGIDGEGEVP